ncbi:peptidase S53 [Pelomonas saccharophila]|nr:peptidase S53 [Roseateles saccharophilus]
MQAAACALILSTTAPAAFAGRSGAAPQDLGATAADAAQTVSIVLKLRHADDLDAYIKATVDPDSPLYHRFLSVEQFRAAFAPSRDEIRRVTAFLAANGIAVNEVYPNGLIIKATGTAAQFTQAFQAIMHDYRDSDGKTFRRPAHGHKVPRDMDDVILYVAGLNTQSSQFKPHSTQARAKAAGLGDAQPAVVLPAGNGTATGVPGSFTTGDVANMYGVNPLYARGITGKGKTIGIATLANFYPSDAYTYWGAIGLNVSPTRITQVHVDGGGDLSANAGSGETTLDVQQSGGLAPDAKMVVYDAPNTEAGFIDVFYKAVADNTVDTLSVSWGSPEILNYDIPGISSESLGVMVAYHQVFAEAAAQGISTFASAGDDGAYDTNSVAPYPTFSKILTVDSPASDPYVIAAGGTTIPADIQRKYGVVHVPTEQVWGWDYFNPYLIANYGNAFKDYYFSVGGGGGVSVFWPQPDYQKNTRGVRRSEPNQVWTYTDPSTGVQTYLYTVPANVKGRNLPDISLNSDPYTGYLVYSTTDGGWIAGYGGTSFASPQLNGIFTLISQAKSSRLGLLHPMLYGGRGEDWRRLSKPGTLDITAGDNWFYGGVKGYEPGAGLGTIDASALVQAIR